MKQEPIQPQLCIERLRQLLRLEQEEEKKEYLEASGADGLPRRCKRGDAWWPVDVGRSYYNALAQQCIELLRTHDHDIEHQFEPGRPVMVFSLLQAADAADTLRPLTTGTVSFVDGDRMVVAIPDDGTLASIVAAQQVGVQLSYDETSYRTMMEALNKVARAKTGRLAELRDLFYSHRQAQFRNLQPATFPYLNNSQAEALNRVLAAKDVQIVHGPPGTGKTTTLVEAIYETLKREPQVLVCAQSNTAVDWISERLLDHGINVLRIGNPTRVNDKMLSFTYERRFEAHPEYTQLWAIRQALRQLKTQKHKADSTHQKIERLKERAIEIELRIKAELFASARVIASTLVGSAQRVMDGQHFTTLFIDEAAQALEPACWIAIRKAGRVVLAGDHCQLPPTVKCYEAMRQGLAHTLMERLAELHPEAVTLLRIQYRMNEDIMRFPARWFYRGKLVAHPSVKWRGLLDLDRAIEWVDTGLDDNDGGEQFVGSTFGRVNPAEAEQTLAVLQNYFSRIGKARVLSERIDVGIISPYRAQVQLMRRLIRQQPFFKPYRQLLTVNTVDGFQGQERDVIVVSMVRSNEQGQIGFLSDLRRMNVAMTRARMKLIIMGNAATLCRHRFYQELYAYVDSLKHAADNTTAHTAANAAENAVADRTAANDGSAGGADTAPVAEP
ncbi:MAG: AAA family ATPase [Prevotella sp.]|nr:AAA family ATPase [Prevotella sp.]